VKGTRIVVTRIVSLVIAAGLLAGMAFGVLATAQSPRPDNQRHVLLVPSDAEGTAALARADARVLARYESFSVVEAQGGDDQRLRSAGAERRDDMRTVETAAGAIDPTQDRSSLAAKEGPDRQETLALVQFVGPPKDSWVERLRETGARIVTYQADNAYVVHARGPAVDRVAALQGGHPAVRAVSVLRAADKLEERSSGSGVFAVTTVTGAPGEEARDEAAALAGPVAAAPVSVGALRTDYRALSSADVAELAHDPGVVAVEAYAEPELFDERAAQIVAGNLNGAFAPTSATYLDWLLAHFPDETFDFAIDVSDGGLDNGSKPPAHPDFAELGGSGERVNYNTDFTNPPEDGPDPDNDARDCSGHGTNVASIAAGYNAGVTSGEQDAGGFNYGLGVAPFVRLGASKIFRSCGDGGFGLDDLSNTITLLTEKAWAGGARISNNSWGAGGHSSWGDYSPHSREYDRMVRDAHPDVGNQGMVQVFAAGNHGDDNPGVLNEGYGTISSEGSAKNVITVGATEGVRPGGPDGCGTPSSAADSARDVLYFSSRGPTDDGRLKPDLVAPGSFITGASPQHPGYTGSGTCNPFFAGNRYSLISGTSQAAPQVSGVAALVRRWYELTESDVPSPGLTKALLINTATDLAGGQDGKGSTISAGPNSDQGWGRVNLGAAFNSTAREYRDQAPIDLLDDSGEFTQRAYSVPDPNRPVKVTLAWTDAPGPTSGNPVVNNLDLVVDAGGRTYKGNVFAGAFSRTGGTADPRNNVESVYLPAGAVTRLGVTVKATTVAGDGVPDVGDETDQDYALVVSNADALTSTPVLSAGSTDLTDAEPGGDADGALEPGESFELEQAIRNGGDGPATTIDGTISGSAPVSFTPPATSEYPDTPPGAVSTNETQFAGQLSASATCGADVTATLSLETDQGIQQVPVVLPTGYPGPPIPRSAGGGPIPDDSTTGVSSTIQVDPTGPPATIRDLDVSISRITHGWVGDLTIQLTGPDGTTVRLAQHPGGPDNSGKNFVGTVFDDEAAVNISSAAAPYSGSFRPQNDELSRFDGKDSRGNWTLRVQDLFEGDTGTLDGWGTSTRTAYCSGNPETSILSGPAEGAFVASTAATFTFIATEAPGTPPFQCSLDDADWEDCGPAGSQTYTGLAQGLHTFEVRGVDAQGDPDFDPARRLWFVDTVAPSIGLDAPPGRFTSAEPTFTGTAGTASGDLPSVAVAIHNSGGALVQSMTVPPSGSTWSAKAMPLADGAYSVRAEQRDAAGNVGSSAVRTFTIDTPDPSAPDTTDPPDQSDQPDLPPGPGPAPPSFVVVPAEERMSEALVGRLTAVAGCASACRIEARVTASSRGARSLGLGAKSTVLGKGTKRLSGAGTATAAVRLNKRARAALRRRDTTNLSLRVKLTEGGKTLGLSRTVSLRRSAGLRRIASRGLRLWAVCSAQCPLRGKLTLSAKEARRIGLKPRGSQRMQVAAGKATGRARKPARLTLKVRPGAKKAMGRARRLRALLETVAGTSPNPRRTVRRALTLRR
jgi:subtilisin-like proprotein convertase family protein